MRIVAVSGGLLSRNWVEQVSFPELGALETRFGCHFLYKGSAPDGDTWKMHSQGVALRGCHLSTLACGSGQAVPSVQSHPMAERE